MRSIAAARAGREVPRIFFYRIIAHKPIESKTDHRNAFAFPEINACAAINLPACRLVMTYDTFMS
jgi:hypothetical protein